MIPATHVRDRALEIMEASGEPWFSAVRRAAAELSAGAPSWLVGTGGAGNWTWFAEFPQGGTAVDISGGAGDTAAAFLSYFNDVVLIESDPAWLRFLAHRFSEGSMGRPRLLSGGVDQIQGLSQPVSYISITFPVPLPDLAAHQALQTCHAALTPGGGIRVAPEWEALSGSPRHLVLSRARSLVAWRRSLRAAGFRGIRGFYTDPSHHDPRLIIPMTRHATSAVERHNLRGSTTRTFRRALAWSGVHWPLYRQCYFLAER